MRQAEKKKQNSWPKPNHINNYLKCRWTKHAH